MLQQKQNELPSVINTVSNDGYNALNYVLNDPNNIDIVYFLINDINIQVNQSALDKIKEYSERIDKEGDIDNIIITNKYRELYDRLIPDIETELNQLPDELIMMITDNPKELDKLCKSDRKLYRRICLNPYAEIWKKLYKKKIRKDPVEGGKSYKEQYEMIYGGKIFTFGKGGNGQLGHGNNNLNIPVEIEGFQLKGSESFNNVTMVSCGGGHTAFIQNGQIYTFGNNKYGQLGHGNYNNLNIPVKIEGFDNVSFLSCGSDYTAFIQDGQVYTFGYGAHGQLGHGDEYQINRPKRIDGFNDVTFVSCGWNYTAFIQNVQVYTFGGGQNDKLGHGDEYQINRPKRIEGFDNVSFVSCGESHTALINKGQVYTFGFNDFDQLGHDNIPFIGPVKIEGFNNVTSVSCGSQHTAFIQNGQVYTFGLGENGQLGHGQLGHGQLGYVTYGHISKPLKIEGFDNVSFISCKFDQTAFIQNGILYTFGNGIKGQLGHGNNNNLNIPKKIDGFNDVTFVSCGNLHTAFVTF